MDDDDDVSDDDDDPGSRLRQGGCQGLEETVDKNWEKKMANELEEAHSQRHPKSRRRKIFRQKFFQRNVIDYL